MLNTIIKYLKTHKIVLFLNLATVILFVCLRLNDVTTHEAIVVDLKQSILKEKTNRQCEIAETRLMIKVSAFSKSNIVPNAQIEVSIMAAYNVALQLASEKDVRCLIMESLGDSMLEAYKAGVSDAKKNSFGSF